MAGHNKWSKIKNKKGSADAKKGKVFAKLARLITVAAKTGGSDPEYNPQLKTAIEQAKAENLPNDNIERAIKKAEAAGEGEGFEEVIYEGYGPGGVAVLVQCLTDNRNRTAPDMRHAFDKYGGNLGQNGSVSFMFDHKGLIVIELADLDEDQVMMDAIEAGADEISSEDGFVEIITEMGDFAQVRDALGQMGYSFFKAELAYIPGNYVSLVADEDIKNMENLVDILEDNDDVQAVHHNWDNDED